MNIQTLPQIENDSESGLSIASTSELKHTHSRDFKPILAARLQLLHEIEPLVSAKFYEQLQAKLGAEVKMAAELSSTAFNRHEEKQKYTHILDAHYFEQRFI